MRKLLLLPLLLGFSVPAIAHNEANGGDAMHMDCIDCGVIISQAKATDGGETEEGDGGEMPCVNGIHC